MRHIRVVNLAGAPNQRLLDFACAECDSAFARTPPHDTHPRVHEEQPEKSDDDDAPQCPHCDKEFTQRSSMCGTCKTCTACLVAATATMFSIGCCVPGALQAQTRTCRKSAAVQALRQFIRHEQQPGKACAGRTRSAKALPLSPLQPAESLRREARLAEAQGSHALRAAEDRNNQFTIRKYSCRRMR